MLVGAVGSGIWDVVAKPGVNWATTWCLRVITLGSVTVRDLPYASAAMNPYSLPSLLVFFFVVMAVPLPSLFLLEFEFLGPLIRRRLERRMDSIRQAANSVEEGDAAVKQTKTKSRRGWVLVLAGYSMILFWFGYVSFGIVNQAVFVRRIHDANMDILTPYITAPDRARVQSSFASMNTKSDYERLRAELERMAATAGVQLRPELVR